MASFNKVLLLGNLTRDPQLSFTPSQTAVCEFGIATNRKWTDQSGNQREEVCFVDCNAFGKQAETLNKYLTKGSPIFLEGRMRLDSWTDQQSGKKRYKHSVTVESFQFLPQGQQQGTQSQPSSNQRNQATPPSQRAPQQQQFAPESDFPHDDIPF